MNVWYKQKETRTLYLARVEKIVDEVQLRDGGTLYSLDVSPLLLIERGVRQQRGGSQDGIQWCTARTHSC